MVAKSLFAMSVAAVLKPLSGLCHALSTFSAVRESVFCAAYALPSSATGSAVRSAMPSNTPDSVLPAPPPAMCDARSRPNDTSWWVWGSR